MNEPISRRGWAEGTASVLADDPVLFAGGGQDSAFHIIYSRLASDQLFSGSERPVVTKLLRDHPYALFIFSNQAQNRWHFINVKHDEEEKKRKLFRRITVGPEERLRTASERISLLDLASISGELFGISPLTIQARHDDAFDVEAVTRQFFDGYQAVFTALEKDLEKQTGDTAWAHDYALQFLNRSMFVYFIQRKGWLGGDKEFLNTFWKTYQRSNQPDNTFVEKWLSVLFFEAFNRKFHGGHRQFPDQIRDILSLAPYLNGGLFSQNTLDRQHAFVITDSRFKQIFTFLEHYNFTIAEDSPLDQEVAVDPEMIGKVYESLVNVSEEANERGDAGIFYTPRIEITLMCRLALVDCLTNHIGSGHKSLLYETVFAIEPEDKAAADKKCAAAGLWHKLNQILKELTVLDPACGSGSFLVGMLHILDDLEERAGRNLGVTEDGYTRKKRIIGETLYGVDVMDWACHVAELRLWLALVADAEFDWDDLHLRDEPLLPHFSFKVRCGDSLVQEVGGINFSHTHTSHKILPALKSRITKLKDEKLKFYRNDPERKYCTIDEIKQEELRLFQDILDARGHKVQEEIKELRKKIEGPAWQNVRLDGTVEKKPKQLQLEVVTWQREMEALQAELNQVTNARSVLSVSKDIPFVWDVAFVEIFEGDKDGFDIVIGNPPYVRQESIADPRLPREETTKESKKVYKDKLARSVYQAFPAFFGYNHAKGTIARKLDAKSDLYIYFYFHGLSLLNPKGAFCFITSNSWLDVGYGKDLQEFLLKYGHVKLILDNQVKRSFASADVNTVIVLFSAPDDRNQNIPDKTARFVMFKAPFEHVLDPIIFEEIEEAPDKTQTKEYRIFPIQHEDLLRDGCELDEDRSEFGLPAEASAQAGVRSSEKKLNEKTTYDMRSTKDGVVRDKKAKGILIKSAKYIGNKWGGKYLRAPDIYWTILEKGKGKLVRLGDIAEVRRGFTTGANEFFYLDDAKIQQWGIEEEFLKPVIKSPKECKRILIDPKDLKYKIFMCHKEKKDLKGTAALEYIKWGESQRFHVRPSCSGRARWWDLGERRLPPIISPSSVSELPRTFENDGVFADKRLYELYPDKSIDPQQLLLATNAITCSLFLELGSRTGLGEGLLDLTVYELADCPVIVPAKSERLTDVLKETRCRVLLSLHDELTTPNRQALDSIVFDILDLTETERDAVYEAVINLVEARLKKANSF